MGNVIKMNTIFENGMDAITIAPKPQIAAYNSAMNSTTGTIIENVAGFVRFANMECAKFSSKSPFYIFGYGVYNGDVTDTPSSSNFDRFVYLDGGASPEYENQDISVAKQDGKFIVILALKNPQESVNPEDYPLDAIVDY